jgi:hypothetical protein
MSFHVPEQWRLRRGNHQFMGLPDSLLSKTEDGCNGAFFFQLGDVPAFAIASDGGGWEHVSISVKNNRTPTWGEMCQVKAMFWDDEDCVVQFHPPQSEYVNCHPFTLHLWRKSGENFETPPRGFVGPQI